jgi:hypothetical protein
VVGLLVALEKIDAIGIGHLLDGLRQCRRFKEGILLPKELPEGRPMDDLCFRKGIGIAELPTVQATVPKILKPLDRRFFKQVLVGIPCDLRTVDECQVQL